MKYKKKRRSSGNRMDLVNSQKRDGHKYHARHGMKNDTTGSLSSYDISLMHYTDDTPKKMFAAKGAKHQAMDDPEFNTALDKYSKQYGINKEWVNRLIELESGGKPTAQAGGDSSATGIIQMIESSAHRVGTSTKELMKMTPTEQLPYAFKYWDQFKGKIKQPSDLYVANMYPAALGKPDDYRLSDNVYNSINKKLDKEGKGYLTVRDIRKHFDPNYQPKFEQPMIIPKVAVADKTYMAPGKSDLFPIQRTTLPSLEKKEPIKYPTGIRSADQGSVPQDIETSDLMELYENPDKATDPSFIQRLFKKS